MPALSEETVEKLVWRFGSNASYISDLYERYVNEPNQLRADWRQFFDGLLSGKLDLNSPESEWHLPAQKSDDRDFWDTGIKEVKSVVGGEPSFVRKDEQFVLAPNDEAILLHSLQAKIVENMEDSLEIPTATSMRKVPVVVLDENRRIINQHLSATGDGKAGFTHLLAWALVKALQKYPSLNAFFARINGKPHKVLRGDINVGIAIDLTRKDGSRMLVVPNIKRAQAMNFKQFYDAYNHILNKARQNKLDLSDFQNTSVSLTNPGTLGTLMSVARLTKGQGFILAAGAIEYRTEFQAMPKELLFQLGISKVMNLSNTYDHRIIQGAESGELLAYLTKILMGEESFYEEVFSDLSMPYKPWAYKTDTNAIAYSGMNTEELIIKQAKIMQMINSYRVRGHLISNVNPLGYDADFHPELDPEFYDLTIWDLNREFVTVGFGGKPKHQLREIIDILRQAYCGKIGIEYMNIQSLEQKKWIQSRVEPKENQLSYSPNSRKRILKNLIRAESFETYLHSKFLGHKRFSIEGAESAIAILDFLIEYAGRCFTEEVVIGMAHRGRINVLANIIGKPYYKLFAEFIDKHLPLPPDDLIHGSGDVKYHLGASGVRKTVDGREVKVWLASNPSHLEAVNPVVEGVARAKQDRAGDKEGKKVMPLLLHGDAAFAGQGVVAETLNLSQLTGYCTNGTIHLIINNQIGFTTTPAEARSSRYATDVAKMVQAPVFHVNGDDPEACIRVARMALDYRLRFGRDVVIDMICYRRHGHNEGDDPAYTQPVLYKKIKEKKPVNELYAERLLKEGIISEAELAQMYGEIKAELDKAYEEAKQTSEKFEDKADPIVLPELLLPITKSPETQVPLETLQFISRKLMTWPENFHVNPKLVKLFEKHRTLDEEKPLETQVDWAFAETLAFGSLLMEGTNVRLSGQDSTRGTFSQRHLALFDTETGDEFMPLSQLDEAQGKLYAFDSMLSEAAVLGFEYGYSLAEPGALVIWEAQFGDFANGAQIIIDQFISSSESKWGQRSGIVMLLPHGYEGQGPEHSSARIERFLQLCAGANIQVCNCTTPAQYFHLLRRQANSGNIKPLVVMSPKSLLRNPMAISKVSELAEGRFHNMLDDEQAISNPKKVVICSGKIYYDLLKARADKQLSNVAILRLEQIYPFPEKRLTKLLQKYASATEICWAQEEPKNMGAWSFVSPLLREHLKNEQVLRYVGRSENSSPSTGFLDLHQDEQNRIAWEAVG
ncbi:2-oxoglutarate dehydrogenase, E1 subunit [Chloroherpeton thalassium ATCC 35110]|uniref:oxoglutarate dehydrogenase (succinyl-transferring) n=1 Tax=Chloroherpeton thalassium (strain ATCC 35110 / GB-78) TaxID=517418 RepID=B3QY52_CHLT3|nr:multifunctional oxoglutarate decarboxylase/oxoglutarate dehydrogenase thiamine pyrophosphate-binding subunit/dihydrolipoyllysine-residue succinyltransferase subunit [Chloroherpeton thalassium]ACF15018.1 2-oxoglutarate dehydrogenase, E1 subunit [Chloroherpeton thalassium ATCC 35110]